MQKFNKNIKLNQMNMKNKQSELRRIKRVIDFYYKRGCNKESVNELYFKILNESKKSFNK